MKSSPIAAAASAAPFPAADALHRDLRVAAVHFFPVRAAARSSQASVPVHFSCVRAVLNGERCEDPVEGRFPEVVPSFSAGDPSGAGHHCPGPAHLPDHSSPGYAVHYPVHDQSRSDWADDARGQVHYQDCSCPDCVARCPAQNQLGRRTMCHRRRVVGWSIHGVVSRSRSALRTAMARPRLIGGRRFASAAVRWAVPVILRSDALWTAVFGWRLHPAGAGLRAWCSLSAVEMTGGFRSR